MTSTSQSRRTSNAMSHTASNSVTGGGGGGNNLLHQAETVALDLSPSFSHQNYQRQSAPFPPLQPLTAASQDLPPPNPAGFPAGLERKLKKEEYGSPQGSATRPRNKGSMIQAWSDLSSNAGRGFRGGSQQNQEAFFMQAQQRWAAGTVAALKPRTALTIRDTLTVVEAAQLMAAKRSDCVLVIDDEGHLAGIITAKDVAFRVVAENLDPRETLVSDIMTRAPFCVTADTAATDALSTMIERRFRHLPVCNEEGEVTGLLDITKCMIDALAKMERAYKSSKRWVDATENEPSQPGVTAMLQYVQTLRDKMSVATLQEVVSPTESIAQVGVKNSVKDAARIMKERGVTAVLVMEGGRITGIFTSKDMVLRVIAAGLHPDHCSVVRVMTPHPDTASPGMTVVDALRKMYEGHYLNLPVVEHDVIYGVVDVLKLTCAMMDNANSVPSAAEGPVWNHFFPNEESTLSHHSNHSNMPNMPNMHMHMSNMANMTHMKQISDEVFPHESASVMDHHLHLHSLQHLERQQNNDHSPLIEQNNFYTFKFSDPTAHTHHRILHPANDFLGLRQSIFEKLRHKHEPPAEMTLSYVDDEKDHVLLSNDLDLQEAVRLAQRQGVDRVHLIVNLGNGLQEFPHNFTTRSMVSEITPPAPSFAAAPSFVTTTAAAAETTTVTVTPMSQTPVPRKRRPTKSSHRTTTASVVTNASEQDISSSESSHRRRGHRSRHRRRHSGVAFDSDAEEESGDWRKTSGKKKKKKKHSSGSFWNGDLILGATVGFGMAAFLGLLWMGLGGGGKSRW